MTLFLLPRRSTDLSVAESAHSEPAWSFELNFRENPFFVEREFPFSKKIIFFFKISRMKVVYLGIHWQSDIRSWINLSNPKLEIQLLVDNLRKPKPFVCSTWRWLCAVGKPRSCKCASLSALCCPEIIIFGFCCCRIKNYCFFGLQQVWILGSEKD